MSMMIYSTPSTQEFIEELEQETRWYELGIHLGMRTHQLDIIQMNFFGQGITRCMIEMYKHLETNDQPRSWENIAQALCKMGNRRLSNELKERYVVFTKYSRLEDSLENSIIIIEKKLACDFEKLRDNLLNLEQEIKNGLKKKRISFDDIIRVVIEYCQIRELRGVDATVDKLFLEMSQQYCFMNYHVLVDLASKFLNSNKRVKKHLDEYERHLEQMKESTTLRGLMRQIHEKRQMLQHQELVQIKLQEFWGNVRVKKFEQVCIKIFKLLYQYLIQIRVEEGCVKVSWSIPHSYHSQLVERLQMLSDALIMIGVMSIAIDDIEVLDTISFVDCDEMESVMSKAIYNSNTLAVDLLITAGININMILPDGHTPLTKSSEIGCYELVALLIVNNVSINKVTTNGKTALLIACTNGHTSIVSLLLEAGAYPNISDNEGLTPIVEAINKEYYEIVRLLLDAKADVDGANKFFESALLIPCLKGHTDIVSLYIDAGADLNATDARGWSPLIAASYKGHLQIVNLLLKQDIRINAVTTTGLAALYMSSVNGHTDIVARLLAAGADPNIAGNQNQTPLLAASNKGFVSIVDLILNVDGTNVNATNNSGRTAVYEASLNGHVSILSRLMKAGANLNKPDNQQRTPITVASKEGHTEIVRLLLEAGANPHILTKNGRSAVFKASLSGHVEIIELLQKTGANLNIPDNAGHTPLMVASDKGLKDVTEILIRARVSINTVNKQGRTALHKASLNGHVDVVHKLLEGRADPNTPDNTGTTPLILSTIEGHHSVVNRLLECGDIRINQSTQSNCTALDYAMRYERNDIEKQLLDNGAMRFENIEKNERLDLTKDQQVIVNLQKPSRGHHQLQISLSIDSDTYMYTPLGITLSPSPINTSSNMLPRIVTYNRDSDLHSPSSSPFSTLNKRQVSRKRSNSATKRLLEEHRDSGVYSPSSSPFSTLNKRQVARQRSNSAKRRLLEQQRDSGAYSPQSSTYSDDSAVQ